MSVLGSIGLSKIVSSGGGAAREFGSAALNQRYALKRQHEAQDFSAEQYAKRYQTQTADMKKAGINPMLAVNQGPGSAPSSSAASGGGQADFTGAETQSAQRSKMEAETKNIKTENTNIRLLGQKLSSEITKVDQEIKEVDQRIKTGRATEQEIILRQELTKRQSELTEMQFKVATQTYNIGRPEEMASATRAAEVSAQVQRVLQPIIDALGGVSKVRKPK